MAGHAYEAGGIRSTVAATRGASDAALTANMRGLITELLRSGVTHFECKTGYGLTVEDEMRALRIARDATDDATLLAAHVVPPEYAGDAQAYVDLICTDLLPRAAGMARWVDVFCDRGAFDVEQSRQILTTARALGFELRMHANQLGHGGAVDLAIELDCASADHCTHLTDDQVARLAASRTVATLLPGAEFSTRSPYPSARRLIDAGVTVAIATDCNPGSSFTTSMPFCIAVAVRDMGFTPSEAVWSATAGGAAALRRPDLGRIAVGARADIVVLNAPSHIHLSYRPGVDLIGEVWQAGRNVIHEGIAQHA
jgi:imidazolonepropionase